MLTTLRDRGYAGPAYEPADMSDADALDKYRAKMWDDLQSRSIGNKAALGEVWRHIVETKDHAFRIQSAVSSRTGKMSKRQNYASINIQAAAQVLEVATLLHTAKDTWFATSAISQCRIALELAAKAVFIAVGADDEPGRWRSAHMLRDKRKRRVTQIGMKEALGALEPLLTKKEPQADATGRVYEWFCAYVHFDARTMLQAPQHERAFAAVAYVAWVIAAAGEIITGVPNLARWPKRLPVPRPW